MGLIKLLKRFWKEVFLDRDKYYFDFFGNKIYYSREIKMREEKQYEDETQEKDGDTIRLMA